MKTVKEVSMITGVSIRTLRYYDEIGLLKPTELTETGYRLYDNKALEKLQAILFCRELEIPLLDIKKIMDTPNCDKEQIVITQKFLLEQKRNRLNGIIELITDVMKGVNTMSFEAFSNDEVQKIVNHTLECMPKENIDEQVQKWIYEYIKDNGFLKPVQIAALKEQPNLANTTQYHVISILNGALPQKSSSAKVSLSEKKLDKYFPPHYSAKQREDVIIQLLEQWSKEQAE